MTEVEVTGTKCPVSFNLVSERYINVYIMNPETNNIHALTHSCHITEGSRSTENLILSRRGVTLKLNYIIKLVKIGTVTFSELNLVNGFACQK